MTTICREFRLVVKLAVSSFVVDVRAVVDTLELAANRVVSLAGNAGSASDKLHFSLPSYLVKVADPLSAKLSYLKQFRICIRGRHGKEVAGEA